MDKDFFFTSLYPLQDRALKIISRADTEFYLTGGTASSRGYLHHRFSEDLDLFVNDNSSFGLWAERVIEALAHPPDWVVNVLLKEPRFVRLSLMEGATFLKIEMVNDVPSHVGQIRNDATLGPLDSAQNILANKISAVLDRQESKDLADIWGFCCKMGLPLKEAITGAQSKAAGVFPADLARVLCSATEADWKAIRWITAPPCDAFLADLRKLGESLILLS